MAAIVSVQLEHLKRLLIDHKIKLDVTLEALEWLAEAGYDPVYGARPLKRVIQRTLQNPLAQNILSGKILDGQTIVVGVNREGLTLEAKQGEGGLRRSA